MHYSLGFDKMKKLPKHRLNDIRAANNVLSDNHSGVTGVTSDYSGSATS